MKNLGQMMKQAQQMQSRMAEMQAALDNVEIAGSSGGGMVQVTMTGKGELRKLKIDPNGIYVSGFSSGGHLCGVVITTNWAEQGLPSDFIKGAVCASGMYDLFPVSLSARNEYVNFNLDDTIGKLSPINHIQNIHFPVVLMILLSFVVAELRRPITE